MSKKVFCLILGSFLVLRLCIMFNVGLIDDEAYHWTWAKNLNYSYFDHPGFVAWAIWPFTQIFGDVEWAIRLPGLLMYLGILFFIYQTGKDIFSEQVARWATVLTLLIPLWGFASLGTLPDVPLGLFWIINVWIFWQSVRPDAKRWSPMQAWLLIGFFMGLGMNSKLTCCLLGLGMGLFLLVTPRVRHHLLTPWPYLGAVLTFVLMTPVFYWNAQHDWASFHYQFLSRHQEARGVDFTRWLQFWSYQWLFMSPMIYFLMLLTLLKGVLTFSKDEKFRFILLLPLPSLLIFYWQPLHSAYKPHWSGPAYMILLFGATQIFLQGFTIGKRTLLNAKSKVVAVLAAITLLPFQLIYIPLFTPVIPQLHQKFFPQDEWVAKHDFTNEFYGWKEVGEQIKSMRQQAQTHTDKPIHFAAQRYELISQLTWGSKEKVWQLCQDRDQFKYDQPDSEKSKLMGDDFIIVNNDKYAGDPQDLARFDHCTRSEFPFFRTALNGEKILARLFHIYYCQNFQGIK